VARRGREGIAKRARERARQERQAAKRERRHAAAESVDDAQEAPDEDALMEEFRELSERHAAGNVPDDEYNEERHRIFVALGIESEED
jgi:hypothetical protein